jgi:hypothetical protein
MTLLQTILRFPLAPEVLALLEKIDSIDSVYDASYQPIERLIEDAGFSRYERRMLKKALSKISRRHAYSCAMHVVIKNELPEAPSKSGVLTRAAMISAAQDEFDKAFATQHAQNLANRGIASLTNPYDAYRNKQQ